MQPPTVDTTVRPSPESIIHTVVPDTIKRRQLEITVTDSLRPVIYEKSLAPVPLSDTIRVTKATLFNPYKNYFNTSDNFLVKNSLRPIGKTSTRMTGRDSATLKITTAAPSSSTGIQLQARAHKTSDWVLLVMVVIVLLFIWIRVFYNKFFSYLANALISYQLSAKMFREKNVLLKRVSFVLDVIYLMVLAIFLYKSFTFLGLSPARMTSYNLFLLFLNILIVYTLARSFSLRLFTYLFRSESVIAEYVHNNFIINKSMGIVLFPLVICICYMPESLGGILFVTGLLLLATGNIFKIIRGYQIIIRKDVLLFYLILYLCTLEILPLLLGYKVFMSLL